MARVLLTISVLSWLILQDTQSTDVDIPVASPVSSQETQRESGIYAEMLRGRSSFVGAQACVGCHRSEYVAWTKSRHFHGGHVNRLDRSSPTSKASLYFQKYGTLDVCRACHAPADGNIGRTRIESGTSCESCHGAAGGEGNWLNHHALVLRHDDAETVASRRSACREAGMIRGSDVYEISRNCLSCHMILDRTLLDDEIGHSPGSELFDLVPWLQGEVRHNFHLDQSVNADSPTLTKQRTGFPAIHRQRLLVIAAPLATMELCLHQLAALSSDEELEEAYAEVWKERASEAKDLLEEITEILAEPDEELNVAPVEDENLNAVIDALDRDRVGRDLRDLTLSSAAEALSIVKESTRDFFGTNDGATLGALDADFLEDLEPQGRPVGAVPTD